MRSRCTSLRRAPIDPGHTIGFMERIETGLLVIGWGKAGKSLARTLGSSGRSVVMVEQSDQMYGGTCINIACVPTKALVHQAELRRDADSAAEWFTAAVDKRDTLTAKLRARNHAMLAEVDAVIVVDGTARFVGPQEVEVSAGEDRLRITGRTVVINTGTVPTRPHLPGVEGPHVHDSTTLQHIDPLPRRLVVVGAGFIGLEFAGMFARFGSEVTLLNSADRLLPGEDADVAGAVAAAIGGAGVEVIHGVRAERFVEDGSGISVEYDGGTLKADAVLLATGRTPATDGLGLDAAGSTWTSAASSWSTSSCGPRPTASSRWEMSTAGLSSPTYPTTTTASSSTSSSARAGDARRTGSPSPPRPS